jgi:RNA polymerase sigma factor (sigma-70 family)
LRATMRPHERAKSVTKHVPLADGADHVRTAAALDGERPPAAPDLVELFRRHHAALVRLAALLVHDLPTAEDVIQDVFAAVQSRPGGASLERGGELTYLRVCVINRCRSVHRRQALWRRITGGRSLTLLDTVQSAEDEVIKAEERQQVLTALAALPARRREVLVLRYYVGMSEAQIASTLGITRGTVKSTAARAIAALARKLGEAS